MKKPEEYLKKHSTDVDLVYEKISKLMDKQSIDLTVKGEIAILNDGQGKLDYNELKLVKAVAKKAATQGWDIKLEERPTTYRGEKTTTTYIVAKPLPPEEYSYEV